MGLYINSPEDMLQEYLYSKKNIPAPNRSKWSDPQVDKLLVKRQEVQRMKAEDIGNVMMGNSENCHGRGIVVPLYNKNGWSVMKSYVKGYKSTSDYRRRRAEISGCVQRSRRINK